MFGNQEPSAPGFCLMGNFLFLIQSHYSLTCLGSLCPRDLPLAGCMCPGHQIRGHVLVHVIMTPYISVVSVAMSFLSPVILLTLLSFFPVLAAIVGF
jgi:hypothetical protein